MAAKPKVSPRGTYVFEENDVEILDDLSLTSIIRDATDLPEPEPLDDDEHGGVADLDFDIL